MEGGRRRNKRKIRAVRVRENKNRQRQHQKEAAVQAPQGPSSLYKGPEEGLSSSLHPSSIHPSVPPWVTPVW